MASSRKQSRETAFKLLFGLSDINDETLELAATDEGGTVNMPEGREFEYVTKLVDAMKQNLDIIDEIIRNQSHGFTIDRIFKTDLTRKECGSRSRLKSYLGLTIKKQSQSTG